MKKTILSYLFIVFTNLIGAQVPSYIPSSNLVGWWPFNNNANDESGNSNNGTLLNGVVSTTDRFGNANSAYSFDGVNDRIFINSAFFDNGWNEYTISAWYFLNTTNNTNNPNSAHIFFNTNPHQGLGYGMNWGGSGKYYFFAGSGTPSSSWNAIFNAQSIQNTITGVWKNVVLTKNGLTFKLYIDGVYDKTWTSSVSIQSYFYKMYFGSTDPLSASEVINGKLDDIGIWARELTPSEITSVFQSGSAGVIEKSSLLEFCKVFPNPANKSLILDLNESSFQKLENNLDVFISSIDGKIVKEIEINRNELNGNYKLDIEELSQGLYFLKLKSGNYFQNIKFIKE